jgi:alpha-L-fucosidase 2
MKSANGTILKKANGKNGNPFYQTETTADPIISGKAIITIPAIKESFVYDLSTKAGQEIILILK